MAPDTSEHESVERSPDRIGESEIPARVRCRRDPDGIVVWLPDEDDLPGPHDPAR